MMASGRDLKGLVWEKLCGRENSVGESGIHVGVDVGS